MITAGLIIIAGAVGLPAAVGGLGFLLPGAQWLGRTVRSASRENERRLALTFDDGPSEPWTAQLLDALAEEHAPATFFVVGANAARYPALVRRMVAEGYVIGNHSYSHPSFGSLSGKLFREVLWTDSLLEEVAGVRPLFVRPPYGHKTPWFLSRARRSGRTVVMWNIAAGDWRTGRSAVEIARDVISRARGGDIILLHDGDGSRTFSDRGQTVAAVRMIVPELRARGFCFVTLADLLRIPAYQALPAEGVAET